ncbi:retrotransposon protein, putative, ty1-copia subclass [Tanacetum coccineum]
MVSCDGNIWLQKGLPEFAKHYCLKIGGLVDYNHCGKLVFHGRIFEERYSKLIKSHKTTNENDPSLDQDDHTMSPITFQDSIEMDASIPLWFSKRYFTSNEDYVDCVLEMALPVQNINHSAFRSMFEKEKLSGNNFNDWFARLKLVLRVEKKMHVIEQPLPPAPERAEPDICGSMDSSYDALLFCFYTKIVLGGGGKPVADYVLKMKGYVEKLERLGYVLPQDITVGLILNGLTKDFVGFVRNYNMHNMGKTIGEIHAMLIEYEKGLPKKAETPQVKGKGKDKKVYIPKPKNPMPTAMERPAKDDACHHCKEVGHWKRNCPVYLAELLKKKKQVGSASSSGIFIIELFSFPNNNSWVYDTGCGTHICIMKQGFRIERKLKQGALYLYVGNGVRAQVEAIGSFDIVLPNGLVICLDNYYGISVSKNDVLYFNAIARNGIYEIDMHDLVPILQQDGLLKSTDDESFDKCESCLSGKMTKKPFPYSKNEEKKGGEKDLLGIIHTDVCGPLRHVSRQGSCEGGDTPGQSEQRSVKCIFIRYPNETMGYYFYFPSENKIVVARYAEFFEKRLISQEISGRAVDLEEIQEEEDTTPSKNNSNIPQEVEGFEPPQPPQEEVIPIRRSERTHRAPNRLCLNVEVEEHSLGDFEKPANYKAAMLDHESKRWVDAMNAEMQSMIDNMLVL